MSWYTVGENWIWFLIAAILAFLLGWLLHGLFRRPKVRTDSEVYVIEKQIADLRASKDVNAKAKIADLEAKLSGLRAGASLTGGNVNVQGASPKLVADLQAQLGKLRAENEANVKLIDDLKGGRVQLGDLKAGKIKVVAPAVSAAVPDLKVSGPDVNADLKAQLDKLRLENDANLKLIDDLKLGKVQLGDLKSGKIKVSAPSLAANLDPNVKLAGPSANVSGPSVSADVQAELAKLRAENAANASLLADLKGGKVSFDDFKAGKVSFSAPTASLAGDVDAKVSGKGWLQAQLAKLHGQANVDADQISALEAQLSGPDAANFDVAGELVALRTKRAADQKLIAKLQAEIAAANGSTRRKKSEAEVAEARTRVAAIAKRTAGGEDNPSDDLEEIYGVGPIISEMLHSMGVTSFRQVARFDKEDIETIGDALEVFPDRITRDDWMTSARELHKKKYGVDPLKGWQGGSQIDD